MVLYTIVPDCTEMITTIPLSNVFKYEWSAMKEGHTGLSSDTILLIENHLFFPNDTRPSVWKSRCP